MGNEPVRHSGALLNVHDLGAKICARIIHRKISLRKGRNLHHVFVFEGGDIVSCTMSKAGSRALEAGDAARVGAYSRAASAEEIEADIRQHMSDVGMAS